MTNSIDVPIIAAATPHYSHSGDAGADLCAAIAVTLEPAMRETVPTGIYLAIPEGFVGFVVPRSGLAAHHGITVVNAPGTVDSGYRGEIKVTLLNTDTRVPYDISIGDRIAQIIMMPVTRARFVTVESLSESHRGADGFGSTGYSVLQSGENE